VPIAPICCVEGFTLADINEFEVEDMRTVLGLLLSCCDWPNGPCGACKKKRCQNAFMVQTGLTQPLVLEVARPSETSVSTSNPEDHNLDTYLTPRKSETL
jgi:hypothetical protein